MVEHALNNTWSKPSFILFFLTQLYIYASGIPVLTGYKAVNPGWVRAVYASLVKVPNESVTYRDLFEAMRL